MYSEYDTLSGGFPHSEISGSTIARISPKLIAACHVLHRLLAPRHPPSALNSLSPTTRTPARRTINQLSLGVAPARKSHAAGTHRCSTIQPMETSLSGLIPHSIHTNQSRFTCQNSSPALGQYLSEVPGQAGKQGFSWRSRSGQELSLNHPQDAYHSRQLIKPIGFEPVGD